MKKFVKTTISLLNVTLVLSLPTSCFHSGDDDNGNDLDVAQPKETLITEPSESAIDQDSPTLVRSPEGDIPVSAVIDWQKFFKPLPTYKQRLDLESKLDTWADNESSADLVKKGNSELVLGRLKAAEISFRKALRIDQDNIEAQLHLANLYIQKGDLTTAFEFLTKVKSSINSRHDIDKSYIFKYRYTLAQGYLARGDKGKGHKVLSDLIGIEKTFTPAYVSLASSYIQNDKASVAEFVVRRGLDNNKNSPALHNLMGAIAMARGKELGAENWFNEALKISPNYSPALINLANIALSNRENDKAEQLLQSALLLEPNNIEALVALGLAQKRLGKISDARSTLTKAVDINPDHPVARFNLAVLMIDNLKRPNIALRLFHEVVQSSPSGSEINTKASGYIRDIKESNGRF